MAQGNKVEKPIWELFFFPDFYCLLASSRAAANAAATKEENHKRVAGASLLV